MARVTEAEAAKMWCPFARVAFVGQGVMNRVSSHYMQLARKSAERGDDRDLTYYTQQQADTHCIGSRCMAWRSAVPGVSIDEGCCGLAEKAAG